MSQRIFIILLAMSLTACFTVPINAPYGKNIKILPPDVPVEVTKRYQKWYALWGTFPLTISDTPAEVIARENLSEVRVYTEDSVDDAISGFFYVIIFPTGMMVPQTIVIEGNRKKPEIKNNRSVRPDKGDDSSG
jgi:hypothetical protein